MLCNDLNSWVVKFQNNPQHVRVLANEWIVSKLAEAIGLPVPQTALVEVSPFLIERMEYQLSRSRKQRYCSGIQFGSRYVRGRKNVPTLDVLPIEMLLKVSNLTDFAGMLALDKWICNGDGRQAVFTLDDESSRYKATFIDHGFAFDADYWGFPDAPLRSVYWCKAVYEHITGWESFSPWLDLLEDFPMDKLCSIAASVPHEWYSTDRTALEGLVNQLFKRRARIRESIVAFGKSDLQPFPNWRGRLRA